MFKATRTIARKIARATAERLAPYAVYDCHGTAQACWTRQEAMAWLPYCSAHAVIMARPTQRVIVRRIQEEKQQSVTGRINSY